MNGQAWYRAVAFLLLLCASPALAQDHQDHAGQADQADPARPAPEQDHQTHQMPPAAEPPPGVAPLTEEDRAAAFPDLDGQHTVHDDAVHSFVLLERIEWQAPEASGPGLLWETGGWIGGDLDRFWFRIEGEAHGGRVRDGEAHLLYGRAIARWWELVAGVRQDIRPGPAQTWAAIGIQGLAPYWFEIEATAYIGPSARTRLRLEADYDLLLTNRLILQPRAELEISGKADPARGAPAGLESAEAGLRLRYEIRRELAPYAGVEWVRNARDSTPADGRRMVIGLRVWF